MKVGEHPVQKKGPVDGGVPAGTSSANELYFI